jgi:hypothetical protein
MNSETVCLTKKRLTGNSSAVCATKTNLSISLSLGPVDTAPISLIYTHYCWFNSNFTGRFHTCFGH